MKTQVTRMVAGTHGGLGRILLTAFVLMTTVPLSVVSYLAIQQVQEDVYQSADTYLNLVADSGAAQIRTWLKAIHSNLFFLASSPTVLQAVQQGRWDDICFAIMQVSPSDVQFSAISITSGNEQVAFCMLGSEKTPAMLPDAAVTLSVSVPLTVPRRELATTMVAYPDAQVLEQIFSPWFSKDSGQVQSFLLDRDGQYLCAFPDPDAPQSNGASPSAKFFYNRVDTARELSRESISGSPALEAVMQGQNGSGFYTNAAGSPVVGAYRWLDEWQVALVVEQPQELALTRKEDLATILIAGTLAVALLTTVLAAVITRQLTHPIVELAVSAVKIAGGDLSQEVQVRRRDEIGILGQAFNVMIAELRSLYEGLEQKVAKRTFQLTQANNQLRYQAMQLALSAEIGRVATSILDLNDLLEQVTDVILDSYALVYEASYVAVFLQDDIGEWLELRANRGYGPYHEIRRVPIGDASLAGQAVAQERPVYGPYGPGEFTEVAVPLRVGTRVVGVMVLVGSFREDMLEQDLRALESLADQMSVAIENARIYAAENEAVERLSRLDHVRLASLSIGSRELATSLNNIIGFSRLLLKGSDGPLNDVQRNDLVAIYKSGYQLLGLIDNMIALSELDSGTRKFEMQPVNLSSLMDEVIRQARQHLMDVAVERAGEMSLPFVEGDRSLLHQSFLGLIKAVAEQATDGKVIVWTCLTRDGPGTVSMLIGSDVLLSEELSARRCLYEFQEGDSIDEMSIELSLARQIIALHSGKMWVGFDADYGWVGHVVLPVVGKD